MPHVGADRKQTMKETTTVRTPRVFAVQHPAMSEALIMEDIAGRTHDRIIVWAQMHLMQAFPTTDLSHLLKKQDWAVVQVGTTFDEVAEPFNIF